jgi:predicted nucleic acid-binding protein
MGPDDPRGAASRIGQERGARQVIHLDTGFLISALRRGSPEDRRLREWLIRGEALGMSAVSWTEFLCGPVDGDDIELAARVVDEPVALLAVDAGIAAKLFNLAGRRRGSLNDCMIAAIALRVGAALATTNVADFRRFQSAGVRITSG